MQFTTISLSLFVAFAAAQNSTLPDLVSQLPTCAAGCLNTASQSAGCATTDFACLCGENKDSFISSITGCIALSSGCSQDDISKLSTLAPEICQAEASNPDPSAVASASGIVASAVGTATASSTPNAAPTPHVRVGLMGAAALAALAL